MESINVLIIEDLEEESNTLIEVLEKNNYLITGVARTLKDALAIFYDTAKKIDIVIVDIFLNGVPDGIAFAETIDAVPNNAKPFVFLTSSTNRNIFERAKLTSAFSYLVKPFNELEILYAIDTAIEQFYEQNNVLVGKKEDTIITSEHLFIKKGKSLKKVKVENIIYIEVEERYCNIITKKEKFVILISLTKVLKLLDETLFYRTHRNYIINSKKIEEIIPSDNLIILSGNHNIILSEKYKSIIKSLQTLK
jgi:DNA-binding LytR/AlgR family response regulator